MSSTNKFCVDCTYARIDTQTQKATCVLCPLGEPNPVWGYASYQYCAVVRQLGGSCGPEAKLFKSSGKYEIL